MEKSKSNKLREEDFIRHKLFESDKSQLQKYAHLAIGEFSVFGLVKYEFLTTFLGPIPGALGLFLRKIFYPSLFSQVGKGVAFGKSVVIRHPKKISLGNRVAIDDYCVIDGRGSGDEGIHIGDDVFIGRGVTIQSKVGAITIGANTSIGAGTYLVSQGGIVIGEMVNIAGVCCITGGAYHVARDEESVREHGKFTKGPIRIDKKCRLGMSTTVLDGVHLAEGTIVGAMSLVTNDLPEYHVAAGIPAKPIYSRKDSA